MTNKNEMLTCTSHGHIELRINDDTIFDKVVGSKELELIAMLYSKAIDDDISLATLITLYCINGDIMELRYTMTVYGVSHCSYLVAIWYNHTYSGLRREGIG